MVYQVYKLHLVNGHTIQAAEPYDLPFKKGFPQRFMDAKHDEFFTIQDDFFGSAYVPMRSIVYISTGEVIDDEK